MARPIGNLGIANILTVAGFNFDINDPNFIQLFGNNQSGNYSSFRQPGASADYQVPSGKTLYVWAAIVNVRASTAEVAFGWAAAGVGLDSASPPGSPAYPGNGGPYAGTYQNEDFVTQALAFNVAYQVPQNQFPFYQEVNAAGATVILYGFVK